MTGAPAAVDPVVAVRTAALDWVEAHGYPTRRDEAWRYAPHRSLDALSFGPPVPLTGGVPDIDAMVPALDGPRIVIVNGVVDLALSTTSGPDGLHLSALADARREHPEVVAAHFDLDADQITDAYMALNLAFGGDGAVVRIADDVQLDVPIQIVDVEVPDESHNASCTGVVIELGARSSATVVETRIGAGDGVGGSNIRTTIDIGEAATLEHILLQDVPSSHVHLGHVAVRQAAGSTFNARSFNLGASYGRASYDVDLTGAGAHADLSGLFFGAGDQVLDQQIDVIHSAENCTSRQTYRGVLDDSSTGVFSGGIDVRPGADGTDAEQSNDNLILSDRAEINTQPRLEILADEVACKHGATVGQLDDTAMYYLRSRGIAVDEARRLLINGFADQVVDEVEIAAVRSWIMRRLGRDDV
ncbi:Fe-S cluster assembly protein SufD [Ilumatobacter coccineus]|uniref:Putative FeS assembly protein SufD n=1 Tax=Ilumatobacter coccineus (strain NBRC 103263 / KCTC 29153 / YM16-304) TaxID=1313172 RepID=A0A6C7EA76_ILUCY|nr:Fe-S cluster assembly protein SufD [Ilumatobacter coccineus]BAN02119.1 putative FeS assembly protein SufD [Ilumatobacter coccineus YM16-304]